MSNFEQARRGKLSILDSQEPCSDFQRGVASGPGFCRFPGLDSTEAERLPGESRPPLPLNVGCWKCCLTAVLALRRRKDVKLTDTALAAVRDAEHRLISRAVEGEEDAFAEIFSTRKNNVYSICLRMTGNVAEAEDLTQEAFIQVHRKLATFRGDSALSSWIHRIAVNTVLMHFRKKVPSQIPLTRQEGQDGPGEPIDLSQHDGRLRGTLDRIALTRAIGDLPQGYRNIFLLHAVKGFGHGEIARLLKCSVGNSKSQLHKARLKIRESLLAVPKNRQVHICSQPAEAITTLLKRSSRHSAPTKRLAAT
jgi:RNA polymerase sigma-70 factor, ECF subfamily